VPAGQYAQAVKPALLAYFPDGQLPHTAPSLLLYFPFVHEVHTDAAFALDLPAGHALHEAWPDEA
jgi:hypothetical protein